MGLGRLRTKEEVLEHWAPSSIGANGYYQDQDLVVLVEALYDILSCERRQVVGITFSIPHELEPLLIRQMLHGWGRFVA